MDFLQLFKDTKRECKIPGSAPTTAQNQSGILGDLVEWIRDSWREVQLKEPDWRWMFSTFSLATEADTYDYTYSDATDDGSEIERFSRWDIRDAIDRPKIYKTADGQATESDLYAITYSQFKYLYQRGSNASVRGRPIHIAVSPHDELLLGPTPDGEYTVTGRYYKSPQDLVKNGDTPEMPEHFHFLIVAETLLRYAEDQSAPELEKKALRLMRSYYSRLRRNQLPRMTYGGPIA